MQRWFEIKRKRTSYLTTMCPDIAITHHWVMCIYFTCPSTNKGQIHLNPTLLFAHTYIVQSHQVAHQTKQRDKRLTVECIRRAYADLSARPRIIKEAKPRVPLR